MFLICLMTSEDIKHQLIIRERGEAERERQTETERETEKERQTDRGRKELVFYGQLTMTVISG